MASGILAACVVALTLLAFSSQRPAGSPLREWPGRRLSFEPGQNDFEPADSKVDNEVSQVRNLTDKHLHCHSVTKRRDGKLADTSRNSSRKCTAILLQRDAMVS